MKYESRKLPYCVLTDRTEDGIFRTFMLCLVNLKNKPIRGFPISLLEDTTQHGDIYTLVDPEGAAKTRSMHWSSVAIFIECYWN